MRTELRLGDDVAVFLGIESGDVGMELIDREVVRRRRGQSDPAAEESRHHFAGVRRIGRDGRAVRKCDLHGRHVVTDLWLLDETRAALQQIRPRLRMLGTRNLAGFGVDDGIGAITDQAAFGRLHNIERLACH